MIYVTTDTHFGHEMMLTHGHRQPGFEDKIIAGKYIPRDEAFEATAKVVTEIEKKEKKLSNLENKQQDNG